MNPPVGPTPAATATTMPPTALRPSRPICPLALVAFSMSLAPALIPAAGQTTAGMDSQLLLQLRERARMADGQGPANAGLRSATWDASATAIILCDFWDSHHSVTAVRRLTEFAPRLDAVTAELRRRGATIIHSPSDCMDAYRDHPARQNALAAPRAPAPPSGIEVWCHRIPEEESAAYPIDQSDGGEDEDATENAAWNARLAAQGRNPATPWLRQSPLLAIHDSDFIAAEGDVVWNVLQARGIRHVILAGVHTNMCVLGRPFGLRQMVRNGFDTVLLRDCTDVMYNPDRWPYVSHFTGLDLVVRHIEEFVCPTITSDQIVGGEPFRFRHDLRPSVLVIEAGDAPGTRPALRGFVRRFLDPTFRVSFHDAAASTDDALLLIEQEIGTADVLVLAGTAALTDDQRLQSLVSAFADQGRPVIGLRVLPDAAASPTDPSSAVRRLFGIESVKSSDRPGGGAVAVAPSAGLASHPILSMPEVAASWTAASIDAAVTLAEGTTVLVKCVPGDAPVAWTHVRDDGGRSFSTLAGSKGDFSRPGFQEALAAAIHWASDTEPPAVWPQDPDRHRIREDWAPMAFGDVLSDQPDAGFQGPTPRWTWLRTLLPPAPPGAPRPDEVSWNADVENSTAAHVFLNGQPLERSRPGHWSIPPDAWTSGDGLRLLVIRIPTPAKPDRLPAAAPPRIGTATDETTIPLERHWQVRFSNEEAGLELFPIPPQFGAPTDLIQPSSTP